MINDRILEETFRDIALSITAMPRGNNFYKGKKSMIVCSTTGYNNNKNPLQPPAMLAVILFYILFNLRFCHRVAKTKSLSLSLSLSLPLSLSLDAQGIYYIPQ